MKKSKARYILAACTALILAAQTAGASFAAETKNSAETAFVRAKVTVVNEEGISGASEDMIDFENRDKWEKEGDWYYYKDPLEDGAEVIFMKGVKIPETWMAEEQEKKFRVVVTAEAAENMDGTANWSDGSVRASTSTITYGKRDKGSKIYETTNLDLELKEYELDSAGNRIPYVNDKVVFPGEYVHKIVAITVHVNADADYTDHGDRDYDDDDDDDGNGRGRRDDVEVIPLGKDGTEVIPIGTHGGIGQIFTGDNAMAVLFLIGGVALAAAGFWIIIKKNRKK